MSKFWITQPMVYLSTKIVSLKNRTTLLRNYCYLLVLHSFSAFYWYTPFWGWCRPKRVAMKRPTNKYIEYCQKDLGSIQRQIILTKYYFETKISNSPYDFIKIHFCNSGWIAFILDAQQLETALI